MSRKRRHAQEPISKANIKPQKHRHGYLFYFILLLNRTESTHTQKRREKKKEKNSYLVTGNLFGKTIMLIFVVRVLDKCGFA